MASLSTCSAFKGRVIETNRAVIDGTWQYGNGAVVVGHRCIVFSGYASYEVATQAVFVFDTKRLEWNEAKVKTETVAYGRVKMQFVQSDVLYAYIGSNNFTLLALDLPLDLLDINEWRHVNPGNAPDPGFGTAGCFVERRNEGFVWGGGDRVRADPWMFSVKTKRWYSPRTIGRAPEERHNHSICSTGNQVFIIGGTGRRINSLDLHVLSLEIAPFQWSSASIPEYSPPRRYLFQATCTESRIFVYGGYQGESCFDVFSIKARRWYKGVEGLASEGQVKFDTNWNSGTSENAAVLTSGSLWIFGGFQLVANTPLRITPSAD